MTCPSDITRRPGVHRRSRRGRGVSGGASVRPVLSGAMTRTGSGLILTARLLDKANPNLVRQEISVIDTPLRHASLNAAPTEVVPVEIGETFRRVWASPTN
jgi:hypothetical protein